MNRWLLWRWLALGAIFVSALPAQAAPNVVLLMADDLGWGDVGFNGNEVILTPNLDAMAANGLVFDRFYAAAPVCSPTRGSCLTGRHPTRYGIPYANSGHMKPEEATLAEVLRKQGYATGHFGKWHLGTLTKTLKEANRGGPRGVAHFSPPQMNGFDVCFATESKVPTFDPLRKPAKFPKGASLRIGWDAMDAGTQWESYGTHYWDETGAMVQGDLLGADSKLIMDRALPFIEDAVKQERAFFAVVWFHTPHLPVVADSGDRKPYHKFDLHTRNYHGCVTALDREVGRLRAKLRDLKVAGNTMVWFCSDNGPEGNAKSPGSAGPFRGRKRSLYEGGVRVPAVLEWPSQITKSWKSAFPAVTSDYFPTVLSALKLPTPSVPMDGIDLMPVITGNLTVRPTPIGFQSRNTLTWNTHQYKLVMNVKKTDTVLELYDLLADPSESRDLSAELPDKVNELKAELLAWQASCEASAQGADYPKP